MDGSTRFHTDVDPADLEVVRQFEHHALYERDFEAAMRYAHPDLTVREAPSLPYRGTYVGLAGQRQLLADVDAIWAFDGDAIDSEFFAAAGGLVVSRVTGRATLRATGQAVDFLVVELFTVRDGRVADIEVYYYDQEPLRAVPGLDRPPTAPV